MSVYEFNHYFLLPRGTRVEARPKLEGLRPGESPELEALWADWAEELPVAHIPGRGLLTWLDMVHPYLWGPPEFAILSWELESGPRPDWKIRAGGVTARDTGGRLKFHVRVDTEAALRRMVWEGKP